MKISSSSLPVVLASLFLVCLLCVAVTFSILVTQRSGSAPAHESAYERIMRTKTLRCGYVTYPPIVMRDPNNGKLNGLVVDVMEEIGHLLGVKIDWAEEVTFGTTVAGLQAGRYDAMCIGFWRSTHEGKFVAFTVPFFYSQIGAYVRADEHRFDKGLEALNDPSVKIVAVEGELETILARRDYPKATLYELPGLADLTQVYQELTSGKADVVFREGGMSAQYMAHNPNKIRRLFPDKVLRTYQNTLALPMDDVRLQSILDSALIEMMDNGSMDAILRKYDPDGTMFLRVVKGYETGK
jgi:ABC-type amino acid transport substrate-binding protein